MRRSLLTRRRALVLIAALLVAVSLLPARVVDTVAGPPGKLVAAALMPFTVPLKTMADSLRRPTAIELGIEDEHHPGQTKLYIEQLEIELAELRRENRALRQVEAVLGEGRGVRQVPARVGRYSGDRVNPTLTINRGTSQGVAVGQVVVTGFSLVGEVEQAGPVTATVRLFTAAESRLQVRLVPPVVGEPPHRVGAWMQVEEDGERFVIEVDRDSPVAVGDLAHLEDSRWPREAQGFVVAQVVTVRPDPRDPHMRRVVLLEPIVPLRSLSQVNVLVPTD